MKKNTKMLTILVLLLAGLLTVAVFAALDMTPKTSNGSSDAAPTTAYKYIVTNVGATYYAKTLNGTTLTSGTDAATVINYALGHLTNGRTVKERVLLQGIFSLTSTVNMPSYAILEVANGGRVEAASGASINMIASNSKSHFEVVGGDWNAVNISADPGPPLVFSNCADAGIRGLKVHNAYYDNIEIDTSSRINVSNVESYNAGHSGIVFGCSATDCILEKCHIHDCGMNPSEAGGGCYFLCEGVASGHFNNNIMRNNLIERVGYSGLSMSSLRPGGAYSATGNIAENNTIIDCGVADGYHPGIACGWDVKYRPTNCIIRYNTIFETGAYTPPNGKGCDGGIETNVNDSQIYGNTIYNISGLGISCDGDRNTIRDNEITNCGFHDRYSAFDMPDSNNNQVLNNTVKSCLGGIHLYSEGGVGSSYNHVAFNHFEDITNATVNITSSTCTGNIIENNIYNGTWRVDDGGTGTIFKNNTAAP